MGVHLQECCPRVTESSELEEPHQGLSGPTLCTERGHPQLHQEPRAHPLTRVSAGTGCCHLPDNPCQRLTILTVILFLKSPLFQLEAISPRPVTAGSPEESVPFFLPVLKGHCRRPGAASSLR